MAFDAKQLKTLDWMQKLGSKKVPGLTADDVRDLIERHSSWVIGNNRCFHNGAYEEIADALNAELDKRDELLKELFNLAAMNELDVGEEMRFSEILNGLGIEV